MAAATLHTTNTSPSPYTNIRDIPTPHKGGLRWQYPMEHINLTSQVSLIKNLGNLVIPGSKRTVPVDGWHFSGHVEVNTTTPKMHLCFEMFISPKTSSHTIHTEQLGISINHTLIHHTLRYLSFSVPSDELGNAIMRQTAEMPYPESRYSAYTISPAKDSDLSLPVDWLLLNHSSSTSRSSSSSSSTSSLIEKAELATNEDGAPQNPGCTCGGGCLVQSEKSKTLST